MSFATGIAVGTALSNSSHSHGDMTLTGILSFYIALTLITLPAFIIYLYRLKKKNYKYYDNAYVDLGQLFFGIIQGLALLMLLVAFIHYLIS